MTSSKTAVLKETSLCPEHIRLGGKMVPFAGWNMPVQFEGLRQEHERVRTKVGLFDVSHMGEFRVKGPNALNTLQWVTTNDVSKLKVGEAQYTLLSNEAGGVVDDLIIYCLEEGSDYLLCVNAANIEKDFNWISDHNQGADLTNESDVWDQIAIQGPKAMELVDRMFPDASQMASFAFQTRNFNGSSVWVARTGYTGEDGVEVFVPKDQSVLLWNDLLDRGEDLGVAPIGLGARDTLRTEMKFSLYGHEIDDSTNPYEACLGWVVKPAAKDFIGRQPMIAVKEQGLKLKLVGFVTTERGIPREGYRLFSFDNKEIGKVTSGTVSPTSGDSIGIGYVDLDHAKIDTEILVEIRQRMVKAKVVKTPFVNSKGV